MLEPAPTAIVSKSASFPVANASAEMAARNSFNKMVNFACYYTMTSSNIERGCRQKTSIPKLSQSRDCTGGLQPLRSGWLVNKLVQPISVEHIQCAQFHQKNETGVFVCLHQPCLRDGRLVQHGLGTPSQCQHRRTCAAVQMQCTTQ